MLTYEKQFFNFVWQIVGEGCVPIEAQVLSVAEHQGIASVSVEADDIPKISNPMDVSVTRLQPPKNIVSSLTLSK